MTRNTRALAVMACLVMVIGAIAFAGGVNARPSVDTGTGDGTSTVSQIQNNTVFDNVSGTDSSTNYTLQVNVSPTETVEMKVLRNDTGEVFHRNDSPVNQSAGTINGGNGGTHWNLSFTGADIDDMERTENENVTVDVIAYNTSDEDVNYSDGAQPVYLQFDDNRTVLNVNDTDADPDTSDAPVDTNDLDNELLDLRISAISPSDFTTVDADERDISGEETEVVIVFSNDTVADDAANAVPSSVSDGDPMFGMTMVLQGDETTLPVRVYHEEPPDSVDDDDDGDTYGVYHDGGIGGEDGIVFHLGSDFDDDDEVAMVGTLNAALVDRIVHQAATSNLNPLRGSATLFGTMILFTASAPVARRKPVEEAIVVEEE